ncbi:branched-chain amino acid aminotransferase 5 / branched-chain amino acid transaminase 5 (BCAT5) [Euphorbia peplus]|nr:branched-chain amino acid aminotransferase 5 / branched-chain amino acid transaminase 5 (BCAT5) [Euphorbia peplus]
MATPITPTSRALSITPGARILKTPLSDDTIWKRLKDAGFDEDSVKRRDKAALIAYIAKLETEIFDLQHHMGLLILEKKDLAANYDQVKSSSETADLMHKRELAALKSGLAEARRREDNLKKALGVEKECIASIEKVLHEMRAESAETKVAAESKFAEARSMMEDAQKKIADAEAKVRVAEALQAGGSQYRRAAERKLQEVEAREDDLNRRITAFKADCDVKEKEIELERQTLSERRKALQQEHESLVDGQASLNQREEYVANKFQELNRIEKELDASKANIEKEIRCLNVEKSNLNLAVASLSQREEAVIEREGQLSKREQELLVLQEKLASRESVEIQKVTANHESILRNRKLEFEAELEISRNSVEEEIEAKRRAWELREVDLRHREEILGEREHDLEVKSRVLAEKENEVTEKMNILDEKERNFNVVEKETKLKLELIEQETEAINRKKLDLERSLNSLEDKKKQVDCAKETLETMKSETCELSALEMKLKEEVDMVRAQKVELMVEEERLKAEKGKFEAEWELIDEKREELRLEAERVAEERLAVSRLLKDERDNLKQEKETMRKQHKHDDELLNREREEFMNKMVQEHSDWFNKIQKEHADFLLGIEMQKRELENSVEKRREEVESYLRDQENAFEIEKKNELQLVSSLREKAAKELEQVAMEMKKLDSERMEINLDREQRDRDWAMLNESIEELKRQTQKLEKQRELLHAEKEEICKQIEHLNKLEDLKLLLDDMEVAKLQQSNMESSRKKISAIRHSRNESTVKDSDLVSLNNGNKVDSSSGKKFDVISSPNTARFSWVKRCAELIFKNSPEKMLKNNAEFLASNQEDENLTSASQFDSSNGYQTQKLKSKVTVIEETHYQQSEDVGKAGRKRGVNSDLATDSNKRRKQQENDASNSAKDINNNCATSNTLEEGDVLVADGTIRISEVTCEISSFTNFSNQEKLEQLHNSEGANQGVDQDYGTIGNTSQGHVEQDLVPSHSEVVAMLNDHLGNDGKEHQHHEVASEKGNNKSVEDPLAIADNLGKVAEDIGMITRSKQKVV